jgi:hypothetical protein
VIYQRLTLPETAARLPAGEPTLILLHRHPDGDAVGSGFALKLLLEAMGCTVCCVCEDEIPERLRFLTEGMQDSIKKENLPSDFTPSQILSVDTASPAQAGTLYPDYEGKFDLMIDHHAKGDMYADGYIDGCASSAGELIYRLSRELVRLGRLTHIPAGVDRLLYAAVSSDTGCFKYSNASPRPTVPTPPCWSPPKPPRAKASTPPTSTTAFSGSSPTTCSAPRRLASTASASMPTEGWALWICLMRSRLQTASPTSILIPWWT